MCVSLWFERRGFIIGFKSMRDWIQSSASLGFCLNFLNKICILLTSWSAVSARFFLGINDCGSVFADTLSNHLSLDFNQHFHWLVFWMSIPWAPQFNTFTFFLLLFHLCGLVEVRIPHTNKKGMLQKHHLAILVAVFSSCTCIVHSVEAEWVQSVIC